MKKVLAVCYFIAHFDYIEQLYREYPDLIKSKENTNFPFPFFNTTFLLF